jgi:uncharacterized membrane protein
MEKQPETKSNRLKLLLSLLIANAIRLLRIIPNNDPIMSMVLPFSRRSSALTSFAFPFLTMASFDFVTNLLGPWTLLTSITYGLVGLMAHYFLKDQKKVGMHDYISLGILGVLIFDFITGVLATPLLFGGTFTESLIGQIPFTAMHLLTTTFFILVVTPLLDKEVLLNKRLDDSRLSSIFSKMSLRL